MSRKCSTIGCCNKVKVHNLYCPTCKSKKYREKNPLMDSYNNLRNNARRRGIFFAVSLDYFQEFCEQTNYLELRGIGGNDMTIDRDKPELGYIDGNLVMMTRAANAAKRYDDEKRLREKLWAEKFKMVEVLIENVVIEVPEDPPF